MSRIVHARIDRETERILNGLKRRLGWTIRKPSEKASRHSTACCSAGKRSGSWAWAVFVRDCVTWAPTKNDYEDLGLEAKEPVGHGDGRR
jgi:hypothetical protein